MNEMYKQYGKPYYEKNKESILKKQHDYYFENRKRIIQRNVLWAKKNEPKRLVYMRQYREMNNGKIKQSQRDYGIKNREKLGRYQKNRARRLKKEAVKLKGGKCEICGYCRCLGVLEFHHKNKEEKERSGDWMKNDFDFNKVVLLCSNCHQELHFGGNYNEPN